MVMSPRVLCSGSSDTDKGGLAEMEVELLGSGRGAKSTLALRRGERGKMICGSCGG